MKRLIKYHHNYTTGSHVDHAKFSNCATTYEVLPYLVPDNASEMDLEYLVLELGYNFRFGKACEIKYERTPYGLHTTHAIKIGNFEIKNRFSHEKSESVNEYLGFITLEEDGEIDTHETLDHEVTSEMLNVIYNDQCFDIVNNVNIGGTNYLVIQGWDAFHHLHLLGYENFESMEKRHGFEHAFDDSLSDCHECGEYDWYDDGCTFNHRVVEDCTLLGVNCGCYDDYLEKNWKSYVNKADQCLSSEIGDKLVEENKIEILATYIGGMTDPGRGGYINGESVSNGQPDELLKKALAKDPKGEYLFVHLESGQFQTYFSMAKVA